jgi:cellulose synthase/poly-beta-1,6-N-acetylglucosamine synthase-like glycosyltransferase
MPAKAIEQDDADMLVVKLLFSLVGLYATFWALYVLGLPTVAMLKRYRGAKRKTNRRDVVPRIAVLIPAHNMEEEIKSCLEALYGSDYPAEKLGVYVVADHCSDRTVDVSREAGAVALEREHPPPGKSYAIAWALERLAGYGEDPDLYVIVDATAIIDPGFLRVIAVHWQEREHIIVGRATVDPTMGQWFVRCMGLTLAHRGLQNFARERLGLSSLIEGRGMAYDREYIKRFGWQLALPDTSVGGIHPTEDWRHGVRAVGSGYRVSFAHEAKLHTPLRRNLGAATRQGLRWERGRIGNARQHGIELLRQGILERNWLKTFAALDSVQPPVAVLAGISLAVLAVSITIYETLGSAILVAASAPLILCYAMFVVARGRLDGIPLWTVLWAPPYLAWRCLVFLVSLSGLDRFLRMGSGEPKRAG